MKKMRVTLVMMAVLVLALGFFGCGGKGKATASNLFTLVPENAAGVFHLDIKKLSTLEFYGKMIDELKNKEATPGQQGEIIKNYQDFVNMTGIDPQKDLYALVFAGFGDLNKKDIDFVMVANLKYDQAKIMNLIKTAIQKENKELAEETYQDLILFKTKDEEGKDIVFSFIPPELIVLGRPGAVKQTIDIYKGKGKSMAANKVAAPYIEDIAGEMGSFYVKLPDDVKKKQNAGMMEIDLTKAECVYGKVDYKSSAWVGEIQMVCHNEAGNKQLVDAINGMKGMAAMAGPEFGELVAQINLTSSADAIKLTFSLTEELIKKLEKKVQEQKAAMPPPVVTEGTE